MVEQTIQEIKEAEAKAGAIVKEAEARCEKMLDEAEEDAQFHREQSIEKALKDADIMMRTAKEHSEQIQQEATIVIDNEIRVLKGLASEKEEAAVSLVIAQFI